MLDRQRATRRRINLGFERFSGIYVWILLLIVFSIWIPDLFLSVQTARAVLSNEATTAMIALAVIVPLAAGQLDLSFPSIVSVAACWAAWALTNHHGIVIAAGGALVIGVLVGLINAFLVVRLRIDSIIATLGSGSILAALAYVITDGNQISIPETGYRSFFDFGRTLVFGLPLPVYYTAGVALILWWVLGYTPAGRHVYATGGNAIAARLVGVLTGRVTLFAFVTTGFFSALAGVVLAAQLGFVEATVGAPYLIPAFTAVFLGATQVRPGRMNVFGTIIAIVLLATGVKGLQLVGAPYYTTDMFNGLALLVAVALAVRPGRLRG